MIVALDDFGSAIVDIEIFSNLPAINRGAVLGNAPVNSADDDTIVRGDTNTKNQYDSAIQSAT
jgi:hypothetical protein